MMVQPALSCRAKNLVMQKDQSSIPQARKNARPAFPAGSRTDRQVFGVSDLCYRTQRPGVPDGCSPVDPWGIPGDIHFPDSI